MFKRSISVQFGHHSVTRERPTMRRKISASLIAFALTIFGINYTNAAPQKFTFKLEGECADSATAGTIEENVTNSCRIVVGINPAKPFRVINLQYKDADGKWQFANDDYGDKINRKSDSSKRVEISVPSLDEDGVFYDFPTREFRVYVAKSGAVAAVASKSFTINYTPEGGEGEEVSADS